MVVSVAQRTGELTEASKARLVGLVQFLDAGVDDGNRTLVFLPINLRDAILRRVPCQVRRRRGKRGSEFRWGLHTSISKHQCAN